MALFNGPIDVFRMAMPLVGFPPAVSLDDGSAEAETARAVYEAIVADALCKHGWSFATKRATLVYQGETGDTPPYAYRLPTDILTPRRVYLDLYPFEAFELRSEQLLCHEKDAQQLQMLYTYRAPETDWPPDFGRAIVHALASNLAYGPLEDDQKGQRHEARADMLLRRARVRDRNAAPGVEMEPNPTLVAAWRGNGELVRSGYWYGTKAP